VRRYFDRPGDPPDLGAALSRVVAETWERLGRPEPFVLREHGAGTGTLAVAILQRLERDGSPLADILRYDPIEIEPRRLDAIATRLADIGRADRLVGPDTGGQPVVGMVLGNEVLDALPTHRVVMREGMLTELLVGADGDRFVDVEAPPSTSALAARLSAEGVALRDGQRGEICLLLDAWIGGAADGLDRGLLLLIDYGYPASELYDPVRRRDGTLRAYLSQRVHDDPYRHVGRQDLTAHVDVSAIERAATGSGLVHLGTTTQAEFLVGAGMQELLQELQADPATTLEGYLAVRSSVMRLLDPTAMGRFRVMGFGRDWPTGGSLSAFGYRLGSSRE
jgi:SAM-dependent MidA family methyltransferase